MAARKLKLALTAAGFALLYLQRSFFLYGLISRAALNEKVDAVVAALGGGEPARLLLLETAAAETDLGNAIDTSWFVGVGLMQFDKIGFEDVQDRTSERNKSEVMQHFGIDVDRATLFDLRWSPLASVVFARLKYKLIPDPIPETLEGRAAYWKRYYNSTAGRGTVDHYIKAAVRNGIT